MAGVDRFEVSGDLDTALWSARAASEGLAPSYRRNVLRWIKLSKTAPACSKRIEQAAQAGRKRPQM